MNTPNALNLTGFDLVTLTPSTIRRGHVLVFPAWSTGGSPMAPMTYVVTKTDRSAWKSA